MSKLSEFWYSTRKRILMSKPVVQFRVEQYGRYGWTYAHHTVPSLEKAQEVVAALKTLHPKDVFQIVKETEEVVG